MKFIKTNDLRRMYLEFFESKGHTVLPSAPLVPQDDNSLLLINSGMAPLKKYFTGQAVPPNKRCASCQKCVRTPDIERVGRTARHGTYFEMLGNFSFGDYFKKEATAWAWEFVTDVLGLPIDRLWVTIYLEDDEAFEIWTEHVGVSPDRIVRLGKEDNFWEIGSGPCGPCSELYFDRGPQAGCGKADCAVGCDCDRYVEFWNLVFTQFNSDGAGNYTLLDNPNIDTGMGLERIACIMQEVGNLFEIDTMKNIMEHVSRIAGVEYKKDEKTDVSLRVITDHIRSTVFLIGDGVVPQNEGRGYVLRRLLRRAARHGRLIGIKRPFLNEVCRTVIEENASAYPELSENRDYIEKVILVEEERFARTIDLGIDMLSDILDRLETGTIGKGRTLPGELAFKLYDTFGFPIDLIREIVAERGVAIDEEGFLKFMQQQRERARAARASMEDVGWEGDALAELGHTTQFVGHTELTCAASVVALLVDGASAETVAEGEKAIVVLDKTPFYAESGGQVGDTGVITAGPAVFEVTDCKKTAGGLWMHIGHMVSGELALGGGVVAAVNSVRRASVVRNHSAAHLLQHALREVLGTHVHQAGSMVDDKVCRFDFTHFSAVTEDELAKVEAIVNDMILEALSVSATEMTIDAAKESGAIALFGEKYGDTVRVVDMGGGRAVELCGGTHVESTAQIGLFKIARESSVAAGVRRIEAVTGRGVLGYIADADAMLKTLADTLKLGNPTEVLARVQAMQAELKERERELDSLGQKLASMQMSGLAENARTIGDIKLVYAVLNEVKPEALRAMTDQIRAECPSMVAVLASIENGKGTLVASAGKDAVAKGVHVGRLIKEVCSLVGGSGGGRPDSAMGGATEIFKLDEVFIQLPSIVEKMLG